MLRRQSEDGSNVVRAVVLLATALLLWTPVDVGLASAQSAEDAGGDLAGWAKGPVRWLLMPSEVKRLKEVSSKGAALRFIELFWAQRDPDPAAPGNPFREEFFKRVEAADLLYPEPGNAGSLTERGRALILLGAPSGLRVTSQEALAWDPAVGAEDNVRVRYLPLEIWSYKLEDMDQALGLALMAESNEREFRVSFLKDTDKTTLGEGEGLLELAARTALALSR